MKQAMRINSGACSAIREGRQEDAARLEAEYARLQRPVQELSSYRGFTAAAETLRRANIYNEFMAALSDLDLARLYGAVASTFSPFPRIWAMEARDRPVERVQAMLRAGARLDLTTKFPRFTVLHWAAQSKRKGRDQRPACVRLPVLQGADLEAKDVFGRTPLHVAISQGSVDDLAVLLEAGAHVRALSGDRELGSLEGQSRTVLMKVAAEPQKVRLLLDHGVDPPQLAADGTDLRQFLRQQVAQAETCLLELPEKKRAGSAIDKRLDASRVSQGMLEPLWAQSATTPIAN